MSAPDSGVVKGSRPSLPQHTLYHLESESEPVLRRRTGPLMATPLLATPPTHTSTPRTAGADWRSNFASSEHCSSNSSGDWSLQGDSGYGGLGSSRNRWSTNHTMVYVYVQVLSVQAPGLPLQASVMVVQPPEESEGKAQLPGVGAGRKMD